jgi:putative transcriptional regulator
MSDLNESSGYLTGQILIAMPQMEDPRFARSVVYLCAHTAEGAMGLVLNKLVENVSFPDLLDQLNIRGDKVERAIRVHFGGPVETGRGFVLHTADYVQDATLMIDKRVALTATVDILKAIADGSGPDHSLLALGYAGWAPGQLEQEIQSNGWLCCPADTDLVFSGPLDDKWERAMGKIGIDLDKLSKLSGASGHA